MATTIVYLGTKSWNPFRSHYAFLIGLPQFFDLKLQKASGQTYNIRVAGQTLKNIKKIRAERYPKYLKSFPDNGLPAADLLFEETTAILTVRIMGNDFFKKSVGGYSDFFKKTFEEINQKNTQNLIIDLRGNHGGDSEVGMEIMRYLMTAPFDYYAAWIPRVRKVKNRKHYQGLGLFVHWLLSRQVEMTEQGLSVKGLSETQNLSPLTPHFTGQIYVLTDGNSFSAAGELTGLLKAHTNAIFVGEEAGGNPIQNISSTTLPLVLPNTGLRVMMPFVLNRTAVDLENTGRGILPDYPIQNSIEEILTGRDAVLEFTLNLAKEKVIYSNQNSMQD